MPGQITHFYLASRVAEMYQSSKDSTLKAINSGFKEILAANLVLKASFEAAIKDKDETAAVKAVQTYRKSLVSSNNIALFSAFCAGAVGPDLWTIPNSTTDTLNKKITGSWYFDLGHYNLSHRFPEYTLKMIKENPAKLSNSQMHYQKAYILGYLSHIALDILAHLKVNVFAGAYHSQVQDVWETEQGNIKEKFNIFNNHNKVEHYLDAYVRFFCFEGYHPDSINYVTTRTSHFGQSSCWHFPNFRSYWKKKLDDADINLSGDDKYILDLSTSLAGAFAHRYKNKESGELVTPFIRNYFWDAYTNADNWLRSNNEKTLHPDNFNDSKRPQEWVKLKFFSIIDDIYWNDLNDEIDTQYYYLHTVIPDLKKVNKNTLKFYRPEAFGHFIQGAIPIAKSFIDRAVAYLTDGKTAHLDSLRFWNLDTGMALRIKRSIPGDEGKTTPGALIDIISVLDDPSLSNWKIPQIKDWNSLPASRKKEWDGVPELADNMKKTAPLSIKMKSGEKKQIILNAAASVGIRVPNTCFYSGDSAEEISAWLLGNDKAYDDSTFIAGASETKADNLYGLKKDDCIEDFTSSFATIKDQTSAGRAGKIYTSKFSGGTAKTPSDAGGKLSVKMGTRPLPRFVKVSTARKWIFHPCDSGNFEPDTALETYKNLYPAEDIAMAIYSLTKSGSGYNDLMNGKTFTENDLSNLKKVKVVGVNVIVLLFETGANAVYKLTNAWIDGEEVTLEDVSKPPIPEPGNGDAPVDPPPPAEDDNEGAIKALMKGMLFDTSKCFLLPSALPSLKKINDIYDYYTKVHLLIVGHTDTAGKPEYNRTLSVERAKALKAYLTDDWQTWYTFYGNTVASEKRWGDHEDRLMIKSMTDYGSRSSNEDEIRWYQRTRGLSVDGDAGPKTREKLIKEYMSIDGTTLPSNAELQIHGCGESHPIQKTGDGVAAAANRRVEVFFFPESISPSPVANCPDSGCSEYAKWLEAAKKDVILDEDSSSSSSGGSVPSTPSGSSSSSSSSASGFKKPAREVHTVFLHCSASDRPEHDSAAVIDSWHKANGWAGIGYHFFIRKDGTIETGRDIEKIPAAQSSFNPGTIAICAHGLKKENFTDVQLAAVKSLCTEINNAYGWTLRFRGHKEVANKACPVFDYKALLNLDSQGNMQK